MTSLRYPIPAGRHRAEQVIERSRFMCSLAHAESAEAAQAFVREMNGEFPEATHNCWAFVCGAPGDTNQVGMSDDGEPHGTAGRPMLTVLLHSGVGEIVSVVTRWYGGTKIGTGGLVKAYGGAVQLALEAMPRAERVDRAEVRLVIGYSAISAVQRLLPALEVEVVSDAFGADVTYQLRLPRVNLAELQRQVADVTRGEARIERVP